MLLDLSEVVGVSDQTGSHALSGFPALEYKRVSRTREERGYMRKNPPRLSTIGVLSDTHGLLRPELTAALEGVDHMIHAGDVGNGWILDQLRRIAPVSVVRGNIDSGEWAAPWPLSTVVKIAGHDLYVLHDIDQLALDPRNAGLADDFKECRLESG